MQRERGNGVRRRVVKFSAIPGNWPFLCIDDDKAELFSFLATSLTALDTEKQIINTHHGEVLCTQPRDISDLAQTDTRILLHLGDAVKEGYTNVSALTVDMDVLVLAVTAAQRLNVPELWVAFGGGRFFGI